MSNFDFLDKICPKRAFLVQNKKREHQYGMQHIQISLTAKFHVKLVVLIFGPNLPKKGIFGLKQEK